MIRRIGKRKLPTRCAVLAEHAPEPTAAEVIDGTTINVQGANYPKITVGIGAKHVVTWVGLSRCTKYALYCAHPIHFHRFLYW